MKRKPFGKCAICGKIDYLTAEHIPPQKAFNYNKIFVATSITDEDIVKKEISDSNTKIHQSGFKLFTLCESCNKNTGSWYGRAYKEFVNQFTPILTKYNGKPNHIFRGGLVNIYPLRVIKQILSMFCSVNENDPDIDDLRAFVYNKNESGTLGNYHLYMYVNASVYNLVLPFNIGSLYTADMSKFISDVKLSEIVTYPLGFALCHKSTWDTNDLDKLVEITKFSQYAYDFKGNLVLDIIIKERLSSCPGGFSFKKE